MSNKKINSNSTHGMEILREKEPVEIYSDVPEKTLPVREFTLTVGPSVKDSSTITLYEYEDSGYIQNSYVYFENEELIVDTWRMGNKTYNEEESFIRVEKEHLNDLSSILNLERKGKRELLQSILKLFAGRESFTNYRNFLELNKIPYSVSTISH